MANRKFSSSQEVFYGAEMVVVRVIRRCRLIMVIAVSLILLVGCAAEGKNEEERIVLSVPFAAGDRPFGLIPMGETVYHPKPDNPEGHPGIDFLWDHRATIVASAPGAVAYLEAGYWPGTWDVVVRTGKYLIGYTEMESYNPTLRVGTEVDAGSFIGYPGPSHNRWMIHWEFGYDVGFRYPDRLCPMTYFDEASRALMEQVWAGTEWEYKPQFPEICSGDFYGKDE